MNYTEEELSSCQAFHKYCNAECCRYFDITVTGERKREIKRLINKDHTINLNYKPSPSLHRYFEMHGLTLTDNKAYVQPSKYHKIQFITNPDNQPPIIRFWKDCEALKDNKCTLHGTPDKPEICTEMNEETINEDHCTNCRFKILKQQKMGGINK